MQSLLFFNKEGDNLNFRWRPDAERWEGNLIFHENSDDTFKTIGIYLFEKIPSLEFEAPGTLQLEKFQLFNEYRFRYSGSKYSGEQIDSIQVSNRDNSFFSKWVYGVDFERKFPVGTELVFDNPIFEFTNQNRSYTVVATKKNAVLIISSVDNRSFESLYGLSLGLTSSYLNARVSGLNSIGVYNYIDSQLRDNLASWNEPDFYSKYFTGKKITVLNTEKNDGVYTVDNINVFDKVYYSYDLPTSFVTQSQNLTIELILKTDVPTVYNGRIKLENNTIKFLSGSAPQSLRPGVEFTIPSSSLNTNPLIVNSIPQFLGNSNLFFYATQSLSIYNNNIYECIQAHTWSATSSITPTNLDYWIPTTYLPLTTNVLFEDFTAEVRLTTNKFYYTLNYTQSSVTTLASAAEQYKDNLKFFNIDLYYEDLALHADLIYPEKYAEVNYYLFTQSVPNLNNKQGLMRQVYEQNVEVEETLTPEVNENICENFVYNIVFTDLDEFGLKIKINGQEYNEQIDFIYVGLNVNLERTIDRTLRNWLTAHYGELATLGIFANLQFIGGGSSIYYNSIKLRTEYPNVPLQFEVKVGSTANFYIQHSEIIFYDMSNYLEISVNGKSYGQALNISNGITTPADIVTALAEWTDNYAQELDDFGIYVENINSKLIFNVKRQNQILRYSVNVGKANLPGSENFKIVNKIKGKFGALMTSNSIILSDNATYSFEDEPFATGQIVSINNTIYPYDNQEYNILYLGPSDLVLSYQGPFWGTTNPFCDVSPYVSVAFNSGFGATGCIPPVVATYSGGGNFNLLHFTQSFSLYTFSPNLYSTTNYGIIDNTNLVDINYLQISGSIYVLGDNLSVYNAETMDFIKTITFTGSSVGSMIMMKFNTYNNYLYCLSSTKIYIVDPVIDTMIYRIDLSVSDTPNSIEFSESNGDIYVTYDNQPKVDVWYFNNFGSTVSNSITTTGNTKKMVFNDSENDIYVTQQDDILARIETSTRIISNTYSISGLFDEIFYEPINSSVYFFDSVGLNRLDNGATSSITGVGTSSFNDLIFNHIGGNLILSQLTSYSKISTSNVLESTLSNPEYGKLSINGFDGDIYLASLNSAKFLVLDTTTGTVKQVRTVNDIITKLIFNPERNSMIGIQPTSNTLIEINVTLGTQIFLNTQTFSSIYDGQFGTLDPNYVPYTDIWLKTREYIRRPRENYNNEPYVKYVWKWETDEYPQMFLFDFSGDQLPTTGPYAYTGEKPLSLISLNRNPNKDLTKLALPEYQQTIFKEIVSQLDHVDEEDNFSFVPEPLQTFIGFNSQDEGVLSSNLLLIKREDITFTITSTQTNYDILDFRVTQISRNQLVGLIEFDVNSTSTFLTDTDGNPRGLKPGQIIKIFISDITNKKDKYLSANNGKEFRILEVYARQMVVDMSDFIINESSKIIDYPTENAITYLNVRFKVQDKVIGRFGISGQTEIEDFRYRIELNNTGHNIDPEDVYIFKPYDINEQGIDWTYLNKKRKEMMMVRHDIFPYVGSYKAIINAINFFGYNDLELYEYYRNINFQSPDFQKLFKVEIPDIFDNTVEGWTENDFIKGTFPNPNFENTNLFNLTYKITDKEGNNLLAYSLGEVIIKLEGLKFWLERKVIPITHKILDITGRADWVGKTDIVHRNYDTKILNVKQSMTPVDFHLNEAYLNPVNSGSTVYTCHIDFSTATSSLVPDYFTVEIRTYKTYKEWNPFTTYQKGDKVTYYGKLYESVISNNRIKNPRKYENVSEWNPGVEYNLGEYAKYERMIYQYIGTVSSFESIGLTAAGNAPFVPYPPPGFRSGGFGAVVEPPPLPSNPINPFVDIRTYGVTSSWLDMTEWKIINLEPVQHLKEYRTGTHSYNFTVDTNIDPFVVVEVTSDNGYGQVYTSKKNYEIRSANDLFTGYKGDPIEPFSPIVQISSPFIANPSAPPLGPQGATIISFPPSAL